MASLDRPFNILQKSKKNISSSSNIIIIGGCVEMDCNKKLVDERSAVAGVIEALLIVALVATVISTIQLVYIPQIMEQREAEHMDEVSNQFSYLKSMIDIQVISKSDAPIFSMITLGSRELPYFISARAFGDLSITNDPKDNITWGGLVICYLTSIEYNAYNSYFVDQTYALEGGGVFVKQPGELSALRVDPPVYIINGTNKVNVYFNLTKIVSYNNKNSTNGYGKTLIRTNYSHTSTAPIYPYTVDGGLNISINTDYPNAWYTSLNNTMGSLVNVSLLPPESPTYVEIKKKEGGKPIDLYLKENIIFAQIGPGWVT